MALTGITKIDQLFGGLTPERTGQILDSIGPGDSDREAVGIIQDFLKGHGFRELPGLLEQARGIFGPKTTDAVRTFQKNQNLPQSGAVDYSTLQALIAVPAVNPIASRGYLTLALDFIFTGMTRLMSLTAQFEGAGLFTKLNLNTDSAGLSFGLIQWAQKPGRLNEILRAFQNEHRQLFVQIFGGGNATLAQGLINHTAKPQGGVNNQGQTTAPTFDLIKEPWVSRFREAGRNRDLQRVQVSTALRAFSASFQKLQVFAPQIRSERGVSFMLDLANQHGDSGAKSIFTKVQRPGLSEADLLLAMQNESVERVRNQYGEGPEAKSTYNRRESFRTSPLLSDSPFNPT